MIRTKAGFRTGAIALLVFCFLSGFSQTRRKPTQHITTTKKPTATTNQNQQNKNPKGTTTSFQNASIIEFRPGQIDTFQTQSSQLVSYFQSTLNFLADPSNTQRDKQTIITQSYLKVFWDSKVQVEDDLDENRAVPLYKDVPAYLSDVSFFFKGATFTYTVQNVNVMKTPAGQTYFKVTANRNLKGLTVNGDSVNSNRVRYVEINYNDSLQQLKIVSIYTTKLSERDDMRNWWNGLSSTWKQLLGKGLPAGDTIHLCNITSFHDSTALISGQTVKIDSTPVFKAILSIINRKSIDLSGITSISDITPLSKMSSLVKVNLARTSVDDLTEIRNLNNLEELDISGTLVATLTPLKYVTKIRVLKMNHTLVEDLTLVGGFSGMEVLEFSRTPVASLEPIKDLSGITDLQFSQTQVVDLSPVSGLTKITNLVFDSTKVEDLTPLKSLQNLKLIYLNGSKVKDIEPLGTLPQLRRIYCDNTGVDHKIASQFMQNHPKILVIFESVELEKWWGGLSEEWKGLLGFYSKLDSPPNTEQLHRLSLVDSVNIKGRSTLTSIEPLAQLKGLRVLDAGNTGISDLSPLSGLTSLTFLNLSNTKITSLAPLKELKELQILYLENTQVSDVKPLLDLSKLKLVYADNTGIELSGANQFVDAHPDALMVFQTYENNSWWKNIPDEWKQLFTKLMKFENTPDKVDLQRVSNLEKLTVTENIMITSLQPVVHLARLKELTCSDTRISTLAPLAQMKSLKAIRVTKNPIADVTPIGTMTWLTELDLSNTQVENLEPIQNLTNLEILKLSGTQVKNLKYLAKMTNLKVVELYNTRVSSLDVFEPMSGLVNLKIFNTKISEKKVEKFKQTHPGCEVIYY